MNETKEVKDILAEKGEQEKMSPARRRDIVKTLIIVFEKKVRTSIIARKMIMIVFMISLLFSGDIFSFSSPKSFISLTSFVSFILLLLLRE